jgi:hypothetical protein
MRNLRFIVYGFLFALLLINLLRIHPGWLLTAGVAVALIYLALRTRAQTYSTYDDYLRSPVWQAKRREALQRDGYRCRVCDSAEQLQVHHRRYPAVLGTETMDDLTTLCDACHQRHHLRYKATYSN